YVSLKHHTGCQEGCKVCQTCAVKHGAAAISHPFKKHLFSQGQQLIYFTWKSLSPSMICALLCLGDW
ncbi:hypothetical protein B0F90DRAFT_1774126, partial [Multifurca ochricompacta]